MRRRNGLFGLVVPVPAIAVGIALLAGCSSGGAGDDNGGGDGGDIDGDGRYVVTVTVSTPWPTSTLALSVESIDGAVMVAPQTLPTDPDPAEATNCRVELVLPRNPTLDANGRCLWRPVLRRIADGELVWAWTVELFYNPRDMPQYLYHDPARPGPVWLVAAVAGDGGIGIGGTADGMTIRAIVSSW